MSESNGDMAQIAVEVPRETKELAKNKLDHGGLSREMRELLARIAHGEDVAQVKRVRDNLENLRDERMKLKTKRDEIANRIADVERKIERSEAKLDRLRDRESEYEGRLKAIEQDMHQDGISVWTTHPEVERVADEYDRDPLDVVSDLKERNPDLPPERFEEGL